MPQVACPSPFGSSSVSCLASTPTLLVAGSRCGRVAVFEARTMTRLLADIPPSTPSASASAAAAAGGANAALSALIASVGNDAFSKVSPQSQLGVVGLQFICSGKAVVVLRANGSVSVLSFVRDSGVQGRRVEVPLRLHGVALSRAPAAPAAPPMTLVQCAGDDCIFGVTRAGRLLEVS